MIAADKLSSMVAAIYLHKDVEDYVTNQEEMDMWNRLVPEIAAIVEQGEVPSFEDWFG
jgi:hypothetical protein